MKLSLHQAHGRAARGRDRWPRRRADVLHARPGREKIPAARQAGAHRHRHDAAGGDGRVLAANGNIAAWQEASIGTEVSGLRLAEVLVNVGDVVKRGQVLATLRARHRGRPTWRRSEAALAEAEATLAEARGQRRARARSCRPPARFSAQQITQYLTAEHTAQARVEAARAAAAGAAAAPGADAGAGARRRRHLGAQRDRRRACCRPAQELFRLIRQGRLEWRAEVTAADLGALKPGMPVHGHAAERRRAIAGKVRMVAPTVDPQTRNGTRLRRPARPAAAPRAGMFARGEFELGSGSALTLPQSAVLLRDGFSYVLRSAPTTRSRRPR